MVIQGFSNFLGLFQGIMANPETASDCFFSLLKNDDKHLKPSRCPRMSLWTPPWLRPCATLEKCGPRSTGGPVGGWEITSQDYRVVKGVVPRGGGSLIFPKVPQSSLGILRVPQLPPPIGTLQQDEQCSKSITGWWQLKDFLCSPLRDDPI